MRKRQEAAALRPIVALACLALIQGAAAAGQVVTVRVGETAVKWLVEGDYEALTLSVSGPGTYLERRFASGDPPHLEIESEKTGRLADGHYSWELRPEPRVSAKMRQELAAARRAMDRGEAVDLRQLRPPPETPAVQSGGFTVAAGVFVQPEKSEPPSKTRQTGDVSIDGSLEARGKKSFVAADPEDAGRQLVYAALEGPEAGTYYRGSSRTIGGEALIELPEHFGRLTESTGLTVQLTPNGGWSRLYVAAKSRERLLVRSADGEDVEFDFLVQGIRRGWAGFEVERRLAEPRVGGEER